MTEEAKFIRGNDRISELAKRPDIADGVSRVRAEMAEADRTYAMGLAALRQAAELTQVELARRLGVTQAAISRVEQPHDLLLSTLNSYLAAIGGRASVVVTGLVGPVHGLLVRGRRGASCAAASSSRSYQRSSLTFFLSRGMMHRQSKAPFLVGWTTSSHSAPPHSARQCGMALKWDQLKFWATPGILEAMKPGRMQGHGGTEEVPR